MPNSPRISRRSLILLAISAFGPLTGCKDSKEKAGPVTFTLKGANDVIAALERKDYDAAVKALAVVKLEVAEGQVPEYRKLLQKVKDTLLDAMGTSEAATQAYQALRFLETGR